MLSLERNMGGLDELINLIIVYRGRQQNYTGPGTSSTRGAAHKIHHKPFGRPKTTRLTEAKVIERKRKKNQSDMFKFRICFHHHHHFIMLWGSRQAYRLPQNTSQERKRGGIHARTARKTSCSMKWKDVLLGGGSLAIDGRPSTKHIPLGKECRPRMRHT